MQQLPGFGSVAWALLCAVLCFVSYSTLKWSVEEFTTTEGNLVTEYVVSSGLVEYRREATTTNLDTGEVQYEHTLYTLECLQLTSRQCDLLRSSQDAGAVAVAMAALMILSNFVTVLIRHAKMMRASLIPSTVSVAFALGVIISASCAVGQWVNLQEDIADTSTPDISYKLDYSWYFMLFTAITAVCTIIGHILAMRTTLVDSESGLESSLFDDNATL